MKRIALILLCSFACAAACANELPSAPAARASAPVATATAAAPGQSGYVHYFELRGPDGALETQVGIELPDQRIAWSFPELGVAVSPFIAAGVVPVNGKTYEVRHLYAIRPFPDEASMRVLQEELLLRVIPWVEDQTPYCELAGPRGELCLSCMGFVTRVLFPGATPAYPALPEDFRHMTAGPHYTTEDLLMYLAGLHGIATREAQLKRVGDLALPQGLREELLRLVDASGRDENAAATDAPARRAVAAKKRPGARSVAKIRPPRLRPRRNSSSVSAPRNA